MKRAFQALPTVNSERPNLLYYKAPHGGKESGNGIVTLYPKDAPALNLVVGKDKKAERAVLASGLLTAIEDLGVTPVEIRAVYVFKELEEGAE